MAERPRVVKQLSDVSIDEVSLVDRGANQHSTIAFSKRHGDDESSMDVFDDVQKDWTEWDKKKAAGTGVTVAGAGTAGALTASGTRDRRGGKSLIDTGNRQSEAMKKPHPSLSNGERSMRSSLGHETAQIGRTVAHRGNAKLEGAAVVAGATSYGAKKLLEKSMTVEELFKNLAKKDSSGTKGSAPAFEEYSASGDPSDVRQDDDTRTRDIGPGAKGGAKGTKKKGKKTPPEGPDTASGSFGSDGDVNPEKLSGLGKSYDEAFWQEILDNPAFAEEVQKSLMAEEYVDQDEDEYETTDEYDEYEDDDDEYDDEELGKAFPPSPGQNPMQSPFPGAMGPGMQPSQQTMGAQPMGMGQPTMPQAGGGMPGAMGAMGAPGAMGGGAMMGGGQQLPPDVVAYIQQLEQALQQLQGNGDDSGSPDSGNDDSASSSSDSSSGTSDKKKNPFGKSGEFEMSDTYFLEELAKSLDDEDQREYIAKALETVNKAEERALEAERIAKAERDLRLEREFIAKAREYNVPIAPEDLGPVLKRCAENLSRDDLGVIVKCLQAATESSEGMFNEIGKRGGGANASVLDEVSARADEMVINKSGLSNEEAFLSVLESDPRAYDEYLNNHMSRRTR